eukprot:SAG31_NODE_8869_length_1370_cov_2.208497_1_plen_39_part_10
MRTVLALQVAALPGHSQNQAEKYRTKAMDLLDKKLSEAA